MPSISLPSIIASAGTWLGGETALGLGSLGIGTETAGAIGSALGPIEAGALTGAATDWRNPLKGAAGGAITGGFGELAGPLSAATGLGQGVSGALTGAAGGALGGLVSGQGPGTGALIGGIEGGLNGIGSPATPAGGASGGVSAASTAAPGAVAAGGSTPDLTSGGGFFDRLGGALGLTGGASSAGPSAVPITPANPNAIGVTSPGATPGATFGSTPAGGSGGFLQSLGLKPSEILPLAGVTAAALRPPPGDLKQLEGMATQFGQQGQALSSAVETGVLPPGLNSALQQATRAATANIKGTYANLGLSGSTMEAQAINAANVQASAQAFTYAQQLLQSGIQESGLSAQLFSSIMAEQDASDNSLTQAIASFAGASAGGNLPAGFRTT